MRRGALGLLAVLGCASGQFTPHPPELGGVPVVHLPRYDSRRLPNGLTVHLNADHYVPMVSIALGVAGAVTDEPAARAGVTALLAAMMVMRTERRDRFELARTYDQVGDGVRVDARADGLILQLDVFGDRLEPALQLLAEIVRHPGFDEAQLERARADQLGALAALESAPDAAAMQGLRQVVFGAGQRLGLPIAGTRRSLASITLDDLRARHAQLFRPGNVALVVCGRIIPEATMAPIERAFGDWSGAPPIASPRAAPPIAGRRGRMQLIARPGQSQTVIYAGRIGPPESDERYPLVRIGARRVASSAVAWLSDVQTVTRAVTAIDEVTALGTLYGVHLAVEPGATAYAVGAVLGRFDARPGGVFEREKATLLTRDGLELYRLPARAHDASGLFLRGLAVDHWLALRDQLDRTRSYAMDPVMFSFMRSDEMHVVLVGDPGVVAAQLGAQVEELRLALD